MNMDVNTYNAIVVIVGCILIGGATYYTKNPNCLWALMLISLMLKS